MTPNQQLRSVGISAEADEDLVIVQMDRSFMTFTPREIEVFYGHLRVAYRQAMEKARQRSTAGEASGALV